jgi:hypothetical protein
MTSGNVWTPSAINIIWKIIGKMVILPGKFGNNKPVG